MILDKISIYEFSLGTDEKAIINVLGNRSNEQRQLIKTQFKTMYGRVRCSTCKLYWMLCVFDKFNEQFNNENRLKCHALLITSWATFDWCIGLKRHVVKLHVVPK